MSQPASPFRGVENLSFVATAVTFVLLVLGNAVRSTGSGLSYLTWPLYNGRVIPDREFHVLMEFSHRAVAGTLTVLVLGLAAVALARPETRARLKGLVAALLVLLAAQVLLGALTVWKLLAPLVVTGHLLTGQLTFLAMLWIHLAARDARGGFGVRPGAAPAELFPLFALGSALTLGQIALGGLVSSHGAGLAVPDFPTLGGRWFPRLEGAVGYQAVHRFGGYLLAVVMLACAWRSSRAEDAAVRAGGRAVAVLVLLQIGLGGLNVLLRIPVWLTALHLATATALLATCFATTFRLGLVRTARYARPVLVAA